jgi:hypothetical protein
MSFAVLLVSICLPSSKTKSRNTPAALYYYKPIQVANTPGMVSISMAQTLVGEALTPALVGLASAT